MAGLAASQSVGGMEPKVGNVDLFWQEHGLGTKAPEEERIAVEGTVELAESMESQAFSPLVGCDEQPWGFPLGLPQLHKVYHGLAP